MENLFSRLFDQCWHCAVEHGLLDDQDIELLQQDDDDRLDQCTATGERRPGAVQHMLFAVAAPFVAIVTAAVGWRCCSTVFVLLMLLSFGLFVLLLSSVFVPFWLPRFACWLWARRVDDPFRHFVLALRQRELALFGLRHCYQQSDSSSSATCHLPFRAQRVQCLHQLCQFVRAFNAASVRLALTSNARDGLLFNFVGDEMRTLCNDRTGTVDDNDLHTNSLKSIWQYHFLVRSEFIRVALLALRHEARCRQCLAFCRHLALILNTMRTTASLHVSVCRTTSTASKTTRSDAAATTTTTVGGGLMLTQEASVCRAQLEWALERMQMPSSSGADGPSWPPPIDVVKCVEQVATTLRHALTECQQQQRSLPLLGDDRCSVADVVSSSTAVVADELAQCQVQQHDLSAEDYQIFELDLARTSPVSWHDDSNSSRRAVGKRNSRSIAADEEAEESVGQRTAAGGVATRDAMLRELGAALTRRKELCLRRERRALARARGVPDEAVPADELDRTPFGGGGGVASLAEATAAQPSSSEQQQLGAVAATSPSPTSSCRRRATVAAAAPAVMLPNHQQGTVLPSADAVAAQRAAILGGAALQPKMEQFGEDDDDDGRGTRQQ